MTKVINSRKAKKLKERLAMLAIALGFATAPMSVYAEDIVLAEGSEEESEEVVPTEATSQPEPTTQPSNEETSEPTPTHGYTDPDDPVPTTEDIGEEESEEERKNPSTTPTPTPESTPTPTPEVTPTPTPESTPTPTPGIPTPTPDTTPTPPPPPKTGEEDDKNLGALALITIASIGGTAIFVGKRRITSESEDKSLKNR